MADYTVEMSRIGDTALSVGTINCTATLRRVKIYDVLVGAEAAGDSPFSWRLQRNTAAGAGSAATRESVNPADSSPAFAALQNMTVDPTYTGGFLLRIPLNQRATMRWVAAREEGKLIIAAVNGHGIGLKTPVAAAVGIASTIMAEE